MSEVQGCGCGALVEQGLLGRGRATISCWKTLTSSTPLDGAHTRLLQHPTPTLTPLTLQQAPDVLVNDATLQLLVELRPANTQDLSSVSGFGAAALQHFGQPLLTVTQVRGG